MSRPFPDPLRHRRSTYGLTGIWRDIQRKITQPRVLFGLPKFAQHIAATFWDAEPHMVTGAVARGDCAFFVAVLLRLDQLDCAMIAQGRTLAERAPIIRARWLVDGFRQAAEENLVRLGGTWPPTAPEPTAPPRGSTD